MLVPLRGNQHGVSIQALQIEVKHFSEYLAYEKLHRRESWWESCLFTSLHFSDSRLYLLKGSWFLFSMAWKWKPAKQWLIRSHSHWVTFPLRNIYKADLKDLRRPDRIVLPLIRIRRLKIETFSGDGNFNRMWRHNVRYCACPCSSPCRRGPVSNVKLVCLALWWKREHLTFISIRFVTFSNQNFADYRS